MAGFAVRNPAGELVHPYQWQASADYTDNQSAGGYYQTCVDNQFSRFAGKLINLYITVIRYDEWEKYAQEIQDLNVNMQNFSVSILFNKKHISLNYNTKNFYYRPQL